MTPTQFAAMRKIKAEQARVARESQASRPAPKTKGRVPLKFKECKQCIFYCVRRVNVACESCDVGENFEERVQELKPGRDNTFQRRDHDED